MRHRLSLISLISLLAYSPYRGAAVSRDLVPL
jgi:hypothetical protein